MRQKRLDIELVLEAVDYQTGKQFVIKFIDRTTKMFKMVRFSESSSEGTYMPDNIKCQKFHDFVN